MLTREATSANFSVFDLTLPEFEPQAFHTLSEHSTLNPFNPKLNQNAMVRALI